MKRSLFDRIFDSINYIILTVYAFLTLYPFLYVLAKSFSAESAIVTGKVYLFPVDFTLNAYRYSLESAVFWKAFAIQAIIMVFAVIWSMLMTTFMAYPLTKKRFVGRAFFTVLVVVPMYFSAGMIPSYLLMRSLGLVNTLFALIIPWGGGMGVLIMKSYMEALDVSMEESAKIDGASNFCILVKLIIPVSMPVIATLSLFAAVGSWTNYLGAAIYLTDKSLQTLQLYLRNLLLMVDSGTSIINASSDAEYILAKSPQAVRAASTITVALPMIILYPFIQKFFTQGLTIGSVKG